MDWDKLRIFKTVAEAGSFTHAGDKLNLSQSAISRQISTLESSLGIPLFHRHARGLILTEQGEMLLQTTCNVFEELQHVENQLTDSRTQPKGPLTITSVEFIASTWLAPLIYSFKKSYPDIQLNMLLEDRVYDLAMREADVGIRLQKTNNNELIESHLTTLKFSLCASKEYLNTHGRPKTIEDFKNHIMIGYPPHMHPPFIKPNWIFKYLDIDIKSNSNIMLINSLQTRYSAVKGGAGIAVIPNYIINNDNDLEIISPEIEIPSVDMYFVYPQERRNSKRIAVLKEFLLKYIKMTEIDN